MVKKEASYDHGLSTVATRIKSEAPRMIKVEAYYDPSLSTVAAGTKSEAPHVIKRKLPMTLDCPLRRLSSEGYGPLKENAACGVLVWRLGTDL